MATEEDAIDLQQEEEVEEKILNEGMFVLDHCFIVSLLHSLSSSRIQDLEKEYPISL